MATATAAYKTRARLTHPDGEAMTEEAMSDSGDGLRFVTTDADRNFWDPRVEPVVEDNGVVVSSGYTVNYLMGQVTFDAPPTGPVTVTGSYLPRFLLPACRAHTLNATAAMLEATVYGDEAVARLAGLFDVSGTLERLESGLEVYDGDAQTLWDLLDGRKVVGLEIRNDNAQPHCTRCYVLINQNDLSGAVGELATASVSFQGVSWANSRLSAANGDPTT